MHRRRKPVPSQHHPPPSPRKRTASQRQRTRPRETGTPRRARPLRSEVRGRQSTNSTARVLHPSSPSRELLHCCCTRCERRTLTALAIFADGRNGIGRTRTGTSVSLFALESTSRSPSLQADVPSCHQTLTILLPRRAICGPRTLSPSRARSSHRVRPTRSSGSVRSTASTSCRPAGILMSCPRRRSRRPGSLLAPARRTSPA